MNKIYRFITHTVKHYGSHTESIYSGSVAILCILYINNLC